MKEYKLFGVTVAHDERSDDQRERDLMDKMGDVAGALKHVPIIGDTCGKLERDCQDRSLWLSGKIIQEMQGSPWNPAERWPTEEEIEEMERRHKL